jgi:hypothetical protein
MMFYPCVFYGHEEAQKYTKIFPLSFSCFFVLFRAFLWLKISDLSFHYSSESKGIEIRNGIATSRARRESEPNRCGRDKSRPYLTHGAFGR